jgi:hypothetical protein
MALGTHDVAFGNDFFRSNNSFSPLPQAVLPGLVNGTSTTINLGSGLYTYLFASYRGQQGDGVGSNFTEVWYVGNLSGVITMWGIVCPGGRCLGQVLQALFLMVGPR